MSANDMTTIRASVHNILQPIYAQRNESKTEDKGARNEANDITQGTILIAQLCDNIASTIRTNHTYRAIYTQKIQKCKNAKI